MRRSGASVPRAVASADPRPARCSQQARRCGQGSAPADRGEAAAQSSGCKSSLGASRRHRFMIEPSTPRTMALPTWRPTFEPTLRMADFTMASAALWRLPPPPLRMLPRTSAMPPEDAGSGADACAGARRLVAVAAPPIRARGAAAGRGRHAPGVGRVGGRSAGVHTPRVRRGIRRRPARGPTLQELEGRFAVDRFARTWRRPGSPPSICWRSSLVIVPMRERGGMTFTRSTMPGHAVELQAGDQRLADAQLGDHVLSPEGRVGAEGLGRGLDPLLLGAG